MTTRNDDGNREGHVSETRAAAQAISELRKRPCLVLVRDEIEPWDVRLLHEQIAECVGREWVDVLLCSKGGSIDGAYRMLREIRRRFAHMTLFVPGWAKSAATLFALAADEIVMGPFGEFGPMDAVNALAMAAPLGRDGSSLLPGIAIEVVRNAATGWVHDAAEAVAQVTGGAPRDTMGHAVDLVTKLSAPVLAQIAPETLAESTRQTDLGRHYGGRVSARYRPRVRRSVAKRQVETLVVGYPSHGFVIDHEELLDMELPVRPMTDEEFAILERLGLYLVRPPLGCADEIALVVPPGYFEEDDEDAGGDADDADDADDAEDAVDMDDAREDEGGTAQEGERVSGTGREGTASGSGEFAPRGHEERPSRRARGSNPDARRDAAGGPDTPAGEVAS